MRLFGALIAVAALVPTAALNLAFTRVVAPISGRVSDAKAMPGNLVTQDQTVLTSIVSLDPIRFRFTGPESEFLKYKRQNIIGQEERKRDELGAHAHLGHARYGPVPEGVQGDLKGFTDDKGGGHTDIGAKPAVRPDRPAARSGRPPRRRRRSSHQR